MIRLIIILCFDHFFSLKIFKYFFLCYIENVILIVIILILIFFFFKLVLFFQNYIYNVIQKTIISYYIYNKIDYFFSIFILVLFFIFYFLFLRLFVFFSRRNLNSNFFEVKNNIILYCYNVDNNYYFIILILLLSFFMLLYVLISILFQIIFLITKFYFLKVHYFKFRRIEMYNFLLEKLSNLELYFAKIFCNYYYYFFFFRKHIMLILLIVLFLYSIIINKGNLNAFLVFVPYYGLYQFSFNVYVFMATKFRIDFEILIMEFYYESINYIMEKNEKKKLEYKRYLLTNFSNYKFVDSVYLFFPSEIKTNYVLVQTNKYTINKFPNDFFSRIVPEKPKIF